MFGFKKLETLVNRRIKAELARLELIDQRIERIEERVEVDRGHARHLQEDAYNDNWRIVSLEDAVYLKEPIDLDAVSLKKSVGSSNKILEYEYSDGKKRYFRGTTALYHAFIEPLLPLKSIEDLQNRIDPMWEAFVARVDAEHEERREATRKRIAARKEEELN